MPGPWATVGDEIEALRRLAGEDAVRLFRHEPDEAIEGMVKSWPAGFDAKRVEAPGLRADSLMEEAIRAHIEDELS